MKVAATMPGRMEIVGMAAHRSAQKLAEAANTFRPEALCIVDPARLEDVVAMIAKYEAFPESKAVIQQYLSAAQDALALVPKSEGRAGLLGLTHYLAEQTEALGVVY